MSRIAVAALALVFFLVAQPGSTPASEPLRVRVGLLTGAQTVRLGGTGSWSLSACGTPTGGGIGGESTAHWSSDGIVIDGRAVTGPVMLTAQSGHVTVNGLPYRGTVSASAVPGGLTVINHVELEQYLYGVVPREMPADWPAEALRAQAVAARTFAHYALSTGKHASVAFDLCADVCCQAYRGVNREDPRSTEAVNNTVGLYVTHGGQPIQAFFHSSSGGHTENVENVWSGTLPYLRGVPDFDSESPRYHWQVSIPIGDAERLLRAAGFDVGALYEVAVTGARGVSGRAINVRLSGSGGHTVMRSTSFRFALGLNSTLFDVTTEQSRAREMSVHRLSTALVSVAGASTTTTARLGATVAIGAADVRHRIGNATLSGWQDLPGGLEFTGRGWGHGVGMSQWGARALAEQGHDFRHILGYYYQGVEIRQW